MPSNPPAVVANLDHEVTKAGGSPSGFLTDNAAVAYVLAPKTTERPWCPVSVLARAASANHEVLALECDYGASCSQAWAQAATASALLQPPLL